MCDLDTIPKEHTINNAQQDSIQFFCFLRLHDELEFSPIVKWQLLYLHYLQGVGFLFKFCFCFFVGRDFYVEEIKTYRKVCERRGKSETFRKKKKNITSPKLLMGSPLRGRREIETGMDEDSVRSCRRTTPDLLWLETAALTKTAAKG